MSKSGLTKIEQFYKIQSLILSDQLSSLVKQNVDMRDLECKESTYSDLVSSGSAFSWIGLYKYLDRGVLAVIDPKIVYLITNRCLGGPGIIEKKPTPKFTFSEMFCGEELINRLTLLYQKSDIPIEFVRSEFYLDQVHYFFSDEKIIQTKINCSIGKKLAGSITLCHPLSFYEETRV